MKFRALVAVAYLFAGMTAFMSSSGISPWIWVPIQFASVFAAMYVGHKADLAEKGQT